MKDAGSNDDALWDEIYLIGAMLGGAYLVGAIVDDEYDAPCSPERTLLIKEMLALPQFQNNYG